MISNCFTNIKQCSLLVTIVNYLLIKTRNIIIRILLNLMYQNFENVAKQAMASLPTEEQLLWNSPAPPSDRLTKQQACSL